MYSCMAKGASWTEVLPIVEVRMSEGISQSLSQSVEKFRSNFMKAFWVVLKACMGLAILSHRHLGRS